MGERYPVSVAAAATVGTMVRAPRNVARSTPIIELETRAHRVAAALTIAGILLLAGCGGGGGGSTTPNAFAGVYGGEYSRAQGWSAVTVAVDTAGNTSVTMVDSEHVQGGSGDLDGEWYEGKGSVSQTGVLTATVTHSATHNSVFVSGQLASDGTSIHGTVSLANDVTCSGIVCNPLPSGTYQGGWGGIYSGSESGTWEATLGADGTVTGGADSPSAGTVTCKGTYTAAGRQHTEGTGACNWKVTWEGVLFLDNGVPTVWGQWLSSSGYHVLGRVAMGDPPSSRQPASAVRGTHENAGI